MTTMTEHERHSFEYIRRYYGVPAEVGQTVEANGYPGEIVGADGQYLLIKLDGHEEAGRWHPTWRIGYIGDDDSVTRFDLD